jgi:hypothetical protein
MEFLTNSDVTLIENLVNCENFSTALFTLGDKEFSLTDSTMRFHIEHRVENAPLIKFLPTQNLRGISDKY